MKAMNAWAHQLGIFLKVASLCLVLVSLPHCGGGTYGTGIRRFEGEVKDTNDQPIPNMLVTLLDSGESGITDKFGIFRIDSQEIDSEVTFLLESPEVDARFKLSNIADDARRVTVQVEVDPVSDKAEVISFSARVWMIGACDPYFDNGKEIKQIKPLAANTRCTLRLRLFADTVPQSNVPYAFEKRECGSPKPWIIVSKGVTGSDPVPGQVEIPFIFQDPKRICEYRVTVPYNYRQYHELHYPIETLVEQRVEEKKN